MHCEPSTGTPSARTAAYPSEAPRAGSPRSLEQAGEPRVEGRAKVEGRAVVDRGEQVARGGDPEPMGIDVPTHRRPEGRAAHPPSEAVEECGALHIDDLEVADARVRIDREVEAGRSASARLADAGCLASPPPPPCPASGRPSGPLRPHPPAERPVSCCLRGEA